MGMKRKPAYKFQSDSEDKSGSEWQGGGSDWTLVFCRKTNKQKIIKVPVTQCSTANNFSVLAFSSDQTPPVNLPLANNVLDTIDTTTKPPSRKAIRRRHAQHILRLLDQQEDAFLDKAIARAEQERTTAAKADTTLPQRLAIEANHKIARPTVSIRQSSKNLGYAIFKRAAQSMQSNNKSPTNLCFGHIGLWSQWALHQQG